MWLIRCKKTGEYIKTLHRDNGLGLPDLHMTANANEAKVFTSRVEANLLVDRFKGYGSPLRLEIIKAWGRRPN